MQTPRLTLRKFRPEDIDELAKILNDPVVMKFSSKGQMSWQDTSEFIDWCIESYENNGYGQWAVLDRETECLIGFCGLSQIEINGKNEIQIGYRLSKQSWGKGLATEAGSEVLRLGFEEYKIKSIISVVSLEHGASINVTKKLGFSDYTLGRYSGWDVRIYRKNA